MSKKVHNFTWSRKTSRLPRMFQLVTAVLFAASTVMYAQANQNTLLKDLFKNYHNEVRPICGKDEPINTRLGIAVRQVIELNEPKQILTLNVWIRMNWEDCQLKWNATNYGGISTLIVPFEKVWVPDVTLYDNAGNELAGVKEYRPAISSTGEMAYNFPTVISILCKVDVTYFPFDTQSCPLRFGSWAYNGLQIDFSNRSNEGDISTFQENSEWKLVHVPVIRHELFYKCCKEPYPDVTFYITLKRKPLFYVLNLLFPCILITTVALLGFILPPDAGEKVSLEITVLLSLAVFLLVVSETLPPTSENFPYIGIYFCLSMLLVTLSTVLTVVVLNFHFKGQHGTVVPRWMKSFFLVTLAKVLCVKSYKTSVHPHVNVDVNNLDMHIQNCQDEFNKPMSNGVNHFQLSSNLEKSLQENPDPQEFPNQQTASLVKILQDQLWVLKRIDGRYEVKHKNEAISEEWMMVAIVLDRLFLILFLVLSVLCTLSILLKCIQ